MQKTNAPKRVKTILIKYLLKRNGLSEYCECALTHGVPRFCILLCTHQRPLGAEASLGLKSRITSKFDFGRQLLYRATNCFAYSLLLVFQKKIYPGAIRVSLNFLLCLQPLLKSLLTSTLLRGWRRAENLHPMPLSTIGFQDRSGALVRFTLHI